MASVRVRIEDFEDGLLPAVCSSSGAPATRLYTASMSSRGSGWVWLLVFAGPVGVVAALVLSQLLRKTAHGYLPYSDETHRVLRDRSRRYAQGMAGCLALALVSLLLLAMATEAGFRNLGIAVGAVTVLVGAGFAFLWWNVPGSVGGHLDASGRWIELDPVSANFAAAYEQQEADRRAARRAEVIGTRLDR